MRLRRWFKHLTPAKREQLLAFVLMVLACVYALWVVFRVNWKLEGPAP